MFWKCKAFRGAQLHLKFENEMKVSWEIKMKQNKKISFVVPVYNTEKKYLDRCVGSLVNQTYNDIEIILVDDGSQKETADLLNTYRAMDNRVSVIHQKNAGPSGARNTALAHIRGGVFCIC